jgi:hypothetical protein
MLSTIAFFAVVSAAIFVYRGRAPRSVHEASLGRMSSTQWIAEYRASKTS